MMPSKPELAQLLLAKPDEDKSSLKQEFLNF